MLQIVKWLWLELGVNQQGRQLSLIVDVNNLVDHFPWGAFEGDWTNNQIERNRLALSRDPNWWEACKLGFNLIKHLQK